MLQGIKNKKALLLNAVFGVILSSSLNTGVCAHPKDPVTKKNIPYLYIEPFVGTPTGLSMGALYPLFLPGNDAKTLLMDAHYQIDTVNGSGGNYGAGYRTRLDATPAVGGLYFFLSTLYTVNKAPFYQANLGWEGYMQGWGFMNNWYMPYGKTVVNVGSSVRSRRVVKRSVITTDTVFEDVVLPGFDLNIGHVVPFLPAWSFVLTYYHYGYTREQEKVDGGSLQISGALTSALNVIISESYDRLSGNQLNIGLQIAINGLWDKDVHLTAFQQLRANDVTMNAIPYYYTRDRSSRLQEFAQK